MNILRKLIEVLSALEAVLLRRKAIKQATRAAVRMTYNGCRV
jgi:hypothetical protein